MTKVEKVEVIDIDERDKGYVPTFLGMLARECSEIDVLHVFPSGMSRAIVSLCALEAAAASSISSFWRGGIRTPDTPHD